MPDFALAHRPAIDPADAPSSPGIRMTVLPEGHVVHILGRPGGPDLADRLRTIAPDEPCAVRTAAPGQWFIVGNTPLAPERLTAMAEALHPEAVASDQSHGRVRIGVAGSAVERMLAKGTAVDLSLAAFPPGHSATTLVGHIAAHLTRLDATAFEVMVLRSFAESLWEDLARMSAEFTGE